MNFVLETKAGNTTAHSSLSLPVSGKINGHDILSPRKDLDGVSREPLVLAPSLTQPEMGQCPVAPRRCPFGGACHTCAVKMQPKLRIGRADDEYEREADHAAETVMRMPEPKKIDEEECRLPGCGQSIQRKEMGTADSPVSPVVYDVLNSPGQPLNGGTRAFMEPRFGHDFSRVRVHADAKAAESAQAVNALAYTVGTDVVFGNGQYEPATANGQRLLGHELAHVVQQGAELQPQVIQRAETDTKGQCSKLKDIADDLNTYVNNSIKSVLSSSSEPFDSAEIVNKTFYSLARPQMVFLCPVEIWANNQPNKSGGGYSLPLFPITKGTKYEYASGSLLNYLAPAVNLNGNCVGTDKIGHMFQQGYQYFLVSESAKSTKKNVPEGAGKGDVYARAWGEWMEGVLSKETQKDPKLMAWLKDMSTKKSDWFTGYKQGYLGLAATGVHSRGDLSANNSGMKFYQDLQANPKMTFDIRKYISEDWDEEKSGNIYEHGVGEAVKKAKRLNPKDEILPK